MIQITITSSFFYTDQAVFKRVRFLHFCHNFRPLKLNFRQIRNKLHLPHTLDFSDLHNFRQLCDNTLLPHILDLLNLISVKFATNHFYPTQRGKTIQSLTEKKFRQINYLVISFVKPLLSRDFCEKKREIHCHAIFS